MERERYSGPAVGAAVNMKLASEAAYAFANVEKAKRLGAGSRRVKQGKVEPRTVISDGDADLVCYGWKGESQVNVEIDNRTVVITEEKRKELQAKLKAIQDSDDSPAPITLPARQTQPQANVGAGHALSDAATTAAQTTISPSMAALGYDLEIRESPSPTAILEAEPVREKPRTRNSVGW